MIETLNAMRNNRRIIPSKSESRKIIEFNREDVTISI